MQDEYAPHRDFIRPAWAVRDLWRVLVMLVAVEIVFMITPPLFSVLLPNDMLRTMYFEGTTAFGTLAQFASFGITALGFLILLKRLHGRGFLSLIGPFEQARNDMISVALLVGFWLLVIEVLPPHVSANEMVEMRNLGVWLSLIPFALAALLIQVGTEELFFRGYLQQQMACLSNSRLVWMVFPSVLFGALHFWNGNGAAEGIVWAIWATALGLACADLTARTGNIGGAIGLHLANNAFALLVVSVEGWPASGLALFVFPYEDPELYAYGVEAIFNPFAVFRLAMMLLTVWIMWLAARIALRR